MVDLYNEEIIKLYVKRYLKKVYALTCYLLGNNKNKAYEVTAASFVEGLTSTSYAEHEEGFLVKLFQTAVEESRQAKAMPSEEKPHFVNIPPEKTKILFILTETLQALSFEEKILLLLRDQAHLSYQNIAAILRISQSDVRSQITQARVNIRKKIERALL